MTELNEPLVYTVDETAAKLGIGRNFAYAAVKKGEIPSIKIGSRILVPKVQFDRMLAGEPIEPATPSRSEKAA